MLRYTCTERCKKSRSGLISSNNCLFMIYNTDVPTVNENQFAYITTLLNLRHTCNKLYRVLFFLVLSVVPQLTADQSIDYHFDDKIKPINMHTLK